jgi:hypothetical protein
MAKSQSERYEHQVFRPMIATSLDQSSVTAVAVGELSPCGSG